MSSQTLAAIKKAKAANKRKRKSKQQLKGVNQAPKPNNKKLSKTKSKDSIKSSKSSTANSSLSNLEPIPENGTTSIPENNNEEEKTPVETKEKEIVEQNSPDVSKEEPDKSNESTTEIKIVTDKLKEKEEDEEQEKPEDDNSKKIDKKEKEKEKLNDNNSIDSQSEDNVSEEEETTKTESEFSKNKGKRQSYNSYFASSSTAHRSLHETFNDKDNSNTKNNNNQGVKDKESKGKEKDEGEEGEEGITENYPAIHSFDDSDKIPTSAKGTKSSSQTANLHTHPYTHNHHSVTKTKVNSPTSAKSPTVFSPFTTEIPSTSGSTSHRSGVRPPSINTNKLGLSSSISQNANTIEYPTSAPIRSNHPTTLMGSVYPPSAITPLHINGDSVNAYTNMILSAQSPTSTKDKVHSHHHNFAFLGNKHILRRKKSNIVRSAASFPNLSHVKN